ncbi:MAG: PIN domain-containing protein [Candidatus Micrarchaeota archaeon]
MQLVVDSNIVFAALIKDSVTRRLFLHLNAEFFIIQTNYQELEKYKKELLVKSGMNEASFNLLLEQLMRRCVLVENDALFEHWDDAKKLILEVDVGDVPFVAAALVTGADIWSDDEHFTKQKKIKIWKTADLMEML